MRRAIVAFPVAADMHDVQAIRERYDPLAKLIAPHVTLVFPFQRSLTAPVLSRHIERAAAGRKPIQLDLDGIVDSENEYLFLQIKRGQEPLVELHKRLYTGPLAKFLLADPPYVPHITVGRIRDDASFREARTETAAVQLTLSTLLRSLSVVRIDASGPRQVELEVQLSAGGTA